MTPDELRAAGVQLEQTDAVELLVGYLVTHADGYEARIGPDKTRAELKNRVDLLDPKHADPDLVDELARKDLGVAHQDEVIVPLEK